MKKILVIVILLFVSTKIWGTGGVDCTDINTPDLSALGFTMKEKTVYDKKGLGVGFNYQARGGALTYYSFDYDLNHIDQEVLDGMLDQGVKDLRYRFSLEKEVKLEDKTYNLNVDSFWDLWDMKKFVNKGKYILSTVETSSGPLPRLDLITVGTDGYCIHKIRWTYSLGLDWEPTPIVAGLKYTKLYLRDFFISYLKVNRRR